MPNNDSIPAKPRERIALHFTQAQRLGELQAELPRNISASTIVGHTLFVACDETSTVERMVFRDGHFTDHRSFPLDDFFDLPTGSQGEMDIEGLAVDGGYLWIAGSHSLKRDKPDTEGEDRKSALKDLTQIECDANRYFLGRVPLEETKDQDQVLVKRTGDDGQERRAACIKMKRGGSKLMRILEEDEHFAPFLNVPSKENGFDIEGLAVRDDRVFLGLRGPVLRGWAIVLQLHLKPKKNHLKPARCKDSKRRYIKHFLDLDGLGIRDLILDGEDLLILAGPTMDLDGPAAVYRWRSALQAEHHSMTGRDELELVISLPCGRGEDHPESVVLWQQNDGRRLLVVYDSPASERVRERDRVDVDVFELQASMQG